MNVVVSANSIVVLGLNFAIDGLLPCPSQMVGMVVILLGVTLSSVAPPPAEDGLDEKTPIDNFSDSSVEWDIREPLLRRFSV